MAHRADLNTLSPAQRTQLVNLMLNYLTDPVVAAHTSIIHSGVEIFTGHRAYVAGMEAYLSANGGAAFDPLPVWNSANPIPPEFNVVKNPGPSRPPLVNLNPNIPKPPQFEYPAVCSYEDPADLGNDINGWHGSVHCAIGGTMCSLPQASAAPIFWCWHAFVDHIYWDWQRCTVPCPDLVGCSLGIAKLRLKSSGLTVGSLTRLSRVYLPSDRYQPSYSEPYQPSYVQPPADEHGHSHGPEGKDPRKGKYETASDVMGHRDHDHGGSGGHGGHPGQGLARLPLSPFSHTHSFENPQPDFSHLYRGPCVVAQGPGPGVAIRIGKYVDLTVVAD